MNMSSQFFTEQVEMVPSSAERPTLPVRTNSRGRLQMRNSLKKQGSIRKLLFGNKHKPQQSEEGGESSSSSTARKALSFDAVDSAAKLKLTRRKSLRLTRSAPEDGALKRNRKPLARQNTFDPSMSASEPSRRLNRFRQSHPPSGPQKQKSCSRLPTRRASKLVRSASFARSASSKTLSRKVKFGGVHRDTYEQPEDTHDAFWYSKHDLDVLLDRELIITARSQGTTQQNQLCCTRGIELQLAGESKAPKIHNYVNTVLRAEDEIRKRSKKGIIDADELLMISQILTKEDRTKAVKVGFKDASEVQVIQNEATHRRLEEKERIRSTSPKAAADLLPTDIKPIISKSA